MGALRRVSILALVAIVIGIAAIVAGRAVTKRGPASADDWDLLVSTRWLADHLDAPTVLVLHVGRDSSKYREGHIPGARFLAIERFVVERAGRPNELPPVADLVAVFESLGVSDDSRIVLYGDFHGLWAARALFTLDYLGRGDRVALLDGGLETWRIDGYPITTEEPTARAGRLSVNPQPRIVVDETWVHEHLDAPMTVLLDARPARQYRGEEAGRDVERPGHIPGSVSLFWEETLASAERPVLLDRDSIRLMYRERGIIEGDTIVTYCRTGIQASHAYFVAKILDHPVKLYDASFLEWSNLTSHPVEVGANNE